MVRSRPVLIGLTTGQRLAIAGVAAVFIVLAVVASFVAPRWNRDFPGRRGLPWFIAATAVLFAAMVATIVIFAHEEEAEAEHAETETQEVEVAEGNPEAGRDVFASAGCGSCHVLEAAGTTGTVGPSLDETQLELEGIVEQVTNGGPVMPAFADSLSEEQIRDVSAFVFQASR